MSEPIRERAILPRLKDPVMISTFTNTQKGGATAASALAYLVNQWEATRVAEFEAEDCYNYGRLRPQVVREGDQAVITWPSNQVYLVNPPEGEHSYLFVIGMEPSLRWRSFVEGIADFAQRMGVKTSIVLRATGGAVTHRQPTQLVGIFSDGELADAFGLPATPMPEGALDIGALLNLEMQSRGCRTADIVALEPFYTAALPDAKAGVALLNAIGQAFHLPVPIEELAAAAQMQYAAIEQSVKSSEEVQALMASLERGAVGLLGNSPSQRRHSSDGPLTDADAQAAVDEVEALFRGFGGTPPDTTANPSLN